MKVQDRIVYPLSFQFESEFCSFSTCLISSCWHRLESLLTPVSRLTTGFNLSAWLPTSRSVEWSYLWVFVFWDVFGHNDPRRIGHVIQTESVYLWMFRMVFRFYGVANFSVSFIVLVSVHRLHNLNSLVVKNF